MTPQLYTSLFTNISEERLHEDAKQLLLIATQGRTKNLVYVGKSKSFKKGLSVKWFRNERI